MKNASTTPAVRSALALLLLYASAVIAAIDEPTRRTPARQGCFPQEELPSHIPFLSAMRDRFDRHDADAAGTPQSDEADPRRRRRRSPAGNADSTRTPMEEGLSSAPTDSESSSAPSTPALPHRRFHPIALGPHPPPPKPTQARVGLPQVFVGQLKKDATAECLLEILRSVAPHVVPAHVEPSINATTGQGRGCAWVTLFTPGDAAAVLALHHRVYLDFDISGTLGFWVCDSDGVMDLRALADRRAHEDIVRRKRRQLPRQPLVVEKAMRVDNNARTRVPPPPMFPRYYPHAGVVFVNSNRYRWDPYIADAFPPPPYIAHTYTANSNRMGW